MFLFVIKTDSFLLFKIISNTMASITAALIWSMRYNASSLLQQQMIDIIAKLPVLPIPRQVPSARYRHSNRNRPEDSTIDWRKAKLQDYIRRIGEEGDADYDKLMLIFNKVSRETLVELSRETIEILKTRDEEFRLRSSTLLFGRGIGSGSFGVTLADLAKIVCREIPEVKDDFEIQIGMFGELYNMSNTITFPKVEDADFTDKTILWASQKKKRRGYANFLTLLYLRELVPTKYIMEAIQHVISDLSETMVQPKSEVTEENVTQFVDFLFEVANLLPRSSVELRGLLSVSMKAILALAPRPTSLNMRSKFRIEDIVKKCV
jgi:hypothetical protein